MWGYEAGVKALSKNGALQADAAVFHLTWHNIQQIQFTTCSENYFTNAGDAASDGFDLAVRVAAIRWLRFGTAVEYADARYTQTTLSGPYAFVSGQALGLPPYTAPPWSGNAWIDAEVSRTDRRVASVRLDAMFRSHNSGPFFSQQPASGFHAPGWLADPAVSLVNLRAQLAWPSLELSAFIDNLFDSQPELGRKGDTPRSKLFYAQTLQSRTAGLAASMRF